MGTGGIIAIIIGVIIVLSIIYRLYCIHGAFKLHGYFSGDALTVNGSTLSIVNLLASPSIFKLSPTGEVLYNGKTMPMGPLKLTPYVLQLSSADQKMQAIPPLFTLNDNSSPPKMLSMLKGSHEATLVLAAEGDPTATVLPFIQNFHIAFFPHW